MATQGNVHSGSSFTPIRCIVANHGRASTASMNGADASSWHLELYGDLLGLVIPEILFQHFGQYSWLHYRMSF